MFKPNQLVALFLNPKWQFSQVRSIYTQVCFHCIVELHLFKEPCRFLGFDVPYLLGYKFLHVLYSHIYYIWIRSSAFSCLN